MLAKGEVKPGMTTEECKLAIGEPIEIRARTDSRLRHGYTEEKYWSLKMVSCFAPNKET